MNSLSFSNANAVLAAKSKSFYWARHFLGQQHAQRATRLYRLCRYMDDLVDESVAVSETHLVLAQTKDALRRGSSSDPVILDGIELLNECNIDPEIFIELIAGVESDLQTVRVPDMDALLHYCYQVAGTVGLMMCKVLESDDKQAFAHAVDLGIAMQLTNICRDVAADAALGRRYLPASLVGDLSPDQLLNPSLDTKKIVQSCMAELLVCADSYYESGERGLVYLPRIARGGILLASRLYKAIGSELKRKELEFWQGRAVVSPARKSYISAQTMCAFFTHPIFWRLPMAHNPALHKPLLKVNSLTTSIFLEHAE